METEKIQLGDELANLIGALRQDGVEKGNEEALKIIEDAKKESARMLDEGRSKADQVLKDARDNAKNTLERLETQLDLALRDFILKAKGELQDLIALKPIREFTDKSLSDPEFIKKLILEMLSEDMKAKSASESRGASITIPKSMEKEFTEEWIGMMKKELNLLVKVHAEDGILGFKISMEGEGGMQIVDPKAIVESLKPFVSEKFQYILERSALPKE
ncbi:MAG: hypothetical protein HN337_03335 [Deltaproteobacteria bacterium]|jgi:V/A-type H+/Na+-transporting ATPase subunit E|nr:hypothetical protein [Deltaproteobacteria bacterium]